MKPLPSISTLLNRAEAVEIFLVILFVTAMFAGNLITQTSKITAMYFFGAAVVIALAGLMNGARVFDLRKQLKNITQDV